MTDAAAGSAGQIDARTAVESMGDMLCVLANDGTITYLNGATRELLGFDASELVGKQFLEFLHPDEVERAIHVLNMANDHGVSPLPGNYRFRNASGGWQTLEVLGSPFGTASPPEAFVIVLRRSHDVVVLADIVRSLIAGSDTTALMDLLVQLPGWKGQFFKCGISWEDRPGHRAVAGDPLPGLLVGETLDPAGPWFAATEDGKDRLVRADELPPHLTAVAAEADVHLAWILPVHHPRAHHAALFTVWTTDGTISVAMSNHAAGIVRQLMELILGWRHQQDELAWSASHDGLTGLLNRDAFFGRLAAADGASGAIVHIDLDRFKPVNDRHGHLVGDAVLAAVARRLHGVVRDGDVVARLGGDEFAVLCPGADLETATAVGHRVIERITAPIEAMAVDVELGASVGVAAGPISERLLEQADHAQLAAKRSGGASVKQAS